MKKFISLFIVFSIVLCSVIIPVSVNAKTVKFTDKTIRLFTNYAFGWKQKGYGENSHYYIKIKNKKYIKAVFFDDGYYDDNIGEFRLEVTGLKVTGKVKPVITVYGKDENSKVSILKKIRFTVKKTQNIKAKNIKVNKGELKRTSIPVYEKYYFNDFYTKPVVFSYSKKGIADVRLESQVSKGLRSLYRSEVSGYFAKGLKYGKTKVTARLKGTKIKLASFYVTVKKLKTSIKKKYKTVTFEYSPNGWVEKQECLLDAILSNTHSGSKYSVSIKNKKIAEDTAHYSWSQCVEGYLGTYIRAKKLGTTTATVYEKKGSSKIKVGSFKIKVKKAKLAEVCRYMVMVSDEVGTDYVHLSYGKTCNLKKIVKNVFLYNIKRSQYQITFKSKNPKYLSVSKNGKVKWIKKNVNVYVYVEFTIKFKDGSKFRHSSEFSQD